MPKMIKFHFKKPGPGRVYTVEVHNPSSYPNALKIARAHIQEEHPGKNYLLYGVTRHETTTD